jgi:hypothetical protein
MVGMSTSGGEPSPIVAYAMRTPSEVVQKRISCSVTSTPPRTARLRTSLGQGTDSARWPPAAARRERALSCHTLKARTRFARGAGRGYAAVSSTAGDSIIVCPVVQPVAGVLPHAAWGHSLHEIRGQRAVWSVEGCERVNAGAHGCNSAPSRASLRHEGGDGRGAGAPGKLQRLLRVQAGRLQDVPGVRGADAADGAPAYVRSVRLLRAAGPAS